MENVLLLSSTKFAIKNPEPFDKPLSKMRMVYITTASKGAHSLDYLERAKKIFAANGYNYEELDLDGKNEQWLRDYMKNFDVVYMQGGNTFYLLKSIRESGFDKVLKDLIPKGLYYIGASAGSYVACPTIEMATWKEPDKYERYGLTDFTGMNLVPFYVSVHYTPEYRDILKEKVTQAKYPVYVLTDEQAILVKDGRVNFIGNQEQIRLS